MERDSKKYWEYYNCFGDASYELGNVIEDWKKAVAELETANTKIKKLERCVERINQISSAPYNLANSEL